MMIQYTSPKSGRRIFMEANLDYQTARHIYRVLDATQGDKRKAAKLLSISLSKLYRYLALFPKSDAGNQF